MYSSVLFLIGTVNISFLLAYQKKKKKKRKEEDTCTHTHAVFAGINFIPISVDRTKVRK